MLSWTLRLAALAILTGSVAVLPARAQNLDAGKTPAQLFSGSCNECHKSSRGLLRSVAPGSLPGFLRQHYTTSTDMAKTLSGFLLANGATETPRVANVPTNRQGRPDALPGNPQPQAAAGAPQPAPDATKQGRRPRPDAPQQRASRPDADGLGPAETQRPPRNAKQGARAPETGSDSQPLATQPASVPNAASKAGVRNTKRGAEPTADTPGALASRDTGPQTSSPSSDAAISAAVPVPDSADLPPPSIADFKPEPPKSDAPKSEPLKPEPPKAAAKAEVAKQQQAAAPAAAAPVSPPVARASSASLAPKPPAGPWPTPPISH